MIAQARESRRARRTTVQVLLVFSLLACGRSPQPPRSASATGAAAPAGSSAAASPRSASLKPVAVRTRVIVFVWDGLRPDSIDPQTTPNLARLRDQDGVNFTNQHAVYPSFTMMNAAALATGAYPARHGFYGNTEYQPGPAGQNADGKAIDFSQPVFTEDHGVLQTLDAFYRARAGVGLFSADTLFQAAHRAGLRTAAVGKVGPAFLQDIRPDETHSVVLDENIALPFGFAKGLQAAGFALPANSARYPYPEGQVLSLAPNNGTPTAPRSERQVRLKDAATPDPRATSGSPYDAGNDYLMSVYLSYILPQFAPDLSVVWLRNPDSTEHQYGPGSANYLEALHDQDALLGRLQAKLAESGQQSSTDLLVVSDHGHSTVNGDAALFPLRALKGEPDGHGEVGALDASGYPVSGEIRSADVLMRAGFRHVYDGGGCLFDPVLSGIRADGSLVYPTRRDANGSCASKPAVTPTGKPAVIPTGTQQPPPAQYSMPSFRVPEPVPEDAIVIAANGGSEYFYVLNHSPVTVRALVLALQERRAFGAIFVRSAYGPIPATLPLSAINAEGERSSPPMPDLIVSFAWDADAVAGGNLSVPGTEYASAQRYRGMHGSFSPRDIHNTLIARGPHFKVGFTDLLPSGNVDLAPTVAALLGLHFEAPDGRVLLEAFADQAVSPHTPAGVPTRSVEVVEQSSEPIRLRRLCNPDDPGCARPAGPAMYSVVLRKQVLTIGDTNTRYTYLDRATVIREPAR